MLKVGCLSFDLQGPDGTTGRVVSNPVFSPEVHHEGFLFNVFHSYQILRLSPIKTYTPRPEKGRKRVVDTKVEIGIPRKQTERNETSRKPNCPDEGITFDRDFVHTSGSFFVTTWDSRVPRPVALLVYLSAVGGYYSGNVCVRTLLRGLRVTTDQYHICRIYIGCVSYIHRVYIGRTSDV